MVTRQTDYTADAVEAARSVLWDIYYCIRYYPGGLDRLVEEFKPHLENGLVKEALKIIAEKFSSPAHIGSKHVADFEDIYDPEERAYIQRDAYERVNALISRLRSSKT